MKIGVDGGGLCPTLENRFGNYVVSENIIRELIRQNKKNDINVYSFCDWRIRWRRRSRRIRLTKYPRIGFSRFWLNYFNGLSSGDVYLALNQYIPQLMKAKVISFSHGLSFMYYPQFYPESYRRMKQQIDDMARRSAYIIVSSRRVKEEWLTFYPQQKNIVVMPFGIPFNMSINSKKQKTRSKQIQNSKFYLYVGMDHPIKNIEFVVDCFNKVYGDRKDIYLYLVGVRSNRLGRIRGNRGIRVIRYCDRLMLRELYRNAQALLTTSYYESFNLPVLEAISLGCPVIGLQSAIIPELQKYCSVAKNKKEFQELLNAIPGCTSSLHPGMDKLVASRDEIRQQFNWYKYARDLKNILES